MVSMDELRMIGWRWADDKANEIAIGHVVAEMSETVVGGYRADSKRYHTSTCSWMAPADTRYIQRWSSALHAELEGRRPCERCYRERHELRVRRHLGAVSLLKLRPARGD